MPFQLTEKLRGNLPTMGHETEVGFFVPPGRLGELEVLLLPFTWTVHKDFVDCCLATDLLYYQARPKVERLAPDMWLQ